MDKLKEEFKKKFVMEEGLRYELYQLSPDYLWQWVEEKLKAERKQAFDDAIGIVKQHDVKTFDQELINEQTKITVRVLSDVLINELKKLIGE